MKHEQLARTFLAELSDELKKNWPQNYNVSPGTGILAIQENRDLEGRREAQFYNWGLVPSWVKDPNAANRPINARIETVQSKPSFRDSMKYRRCIVPASGYFEWKRRGTHKQPYYFYYPNSEPLWMAGIYEHWLHPEGSEIFSACLLTRKSEGVAAEVHHRMPVILDDAGAQKWMHYRNETPALAIESVQKHIQIGLESHPVGMAVNHSKSNGPDLVEPVLADEPPEQMGLF